MKNEPWERPTIKAWRVVHDLMLIDGDGEDQYTHSAVKMSFLEALDVKNEGCTVAFWPDAC